MSNEVFIHPTALVEKGAQLDEGVHVGPFSIVGSHVRVGKNSRLFSHVVLTGHTTLGAENQIYPFASVGHAPQDLKYKGEPTTLVIGDRNLIRESTTLQVGTVQGGGTTVVGHGNLFMAYTHVAHDCRLGNDNILANGVQLAGHVTIDNDAVIGGISAVHQFCHIGDMAMTGGGAMLVEDLPPYCIAQGDRAMLRGLNLVKMRRKGLSAEALRAVKDAYKLLFLSGAPTVSDAVAKVELAGFLKFPEVLKLVEFVKTSQRGVVRPAQDVSVESDA